MGETTTDSETTSETKKTTTKRPRMWVEMDYCLEHKDVPHFVGPAGIGKTESVKAWAADKGMRVVTISLAQVAPADMLAKVPYSVEDAKEIAYKLMTFIMEDLRPQFPGEKICLLWDELSRSHPEVLNQTMECLNEYSLGGVPLATYDEDGNVTEGVAIQVALDNPAGDEDFTGVLELDWAQATRMSHPDPVTVKDTGALEFLKAKYAADYDMESLIKDYTTWSSAEHRTVSPRVLDAMLTVGKLGFPLAFALPYVNGREKIMVEDGTDVTVKRLKRLSELMGLPYRTSVANVVPKAIDAALNLGLNVRMVGDPGVGKTSVIKAAVKDAGLEGVYFNMPTTTPVDLGVPVPMDGGLQFIVDAKLASAADKVIIADEPSRAPTETNAAMMGITQGGKIGNTPIPGLRAVLSSDNGAQVEGMDLDVGRMDLAQASRYQLTLEVTADDIDYGTYLRSVYGDDVVQPFITWRSEMLDDRERALVSPRVLERMIKRYLGKRPIAEALPLVEVTEDDGKRRQVRPVNTLQLEAVLAGVKFITLPHIAANVDEYEQRLLAGEQDAKIEVAGAFSSADLSTLEHHRSALLQLLMLLDPTDRLTLASAGKPDVMAFWIKMLIDPGLQHKAKRRKAA